MGIQIHKIRIQDLGPIKELALDLDRFNLIYGRNEAGKTLLVEFILQSLFKNAARWDLRDVPGEGFISVLGFGEGEVIFGPSSPKKIEDYWSVTEQGFPLNLARLLVVKGGELNLVANAPGGVNRDLLKSVLTSQDLIDRIWKAIPPTVQKARLENQQITGNNQGQIKDLNQHIADLDTIVHLNNQVDEKYSRGPARQIELRLVEIQAALEEQLMAKRHRAYELARERDLLQAERSIFSDEVLSRLRDMIRDHSQGTGDVKGLRQKLRRLEKDLADFNWLEAALEIWASSKLDQKGFPRWFVVNGSLVGLAAGITMLLLDRYQVIQNLFWPGLGLAVLSSAAVLFSPLKLRYLFSSLEDSREKTLIQEEFKERFSTLPRSLADLQSRKKMLLDSYHRGKSLQEQIKDTTQKLERDASQINKLIGDLTDKKGDQKSWDMIYRDLKSQAEQRSDRIQTLELELARLNLKNDQHLAEQTSAEYNPEIEESLLKNLESLEHKLKSFQSELDSLKVRVCDQTGDDPSAPWPNLYYDLGEKRKVKEKELIHLTAELAAKIGLGGVLHSLEEEENLKINSDLHGVEVSSLLKLITGHYQELDLEGDQVTIRDRFRSYPLSQVSTGAREQTQIALRLGIASHLAGGSPLFLVLDDAFQHSDWQRRESLLKGVLELAKSGWQIVCLTMDDHIRDLFQKGAGRTLKNHFKYYEMK
jgi:uncharacterized protein YhaN